MSAVETVTLKVNQPQWFGSASNTPPLPRLVYVSLAGAPDHRYLAEYDEQRGCYVTMMQKDAPYRPELRSVGDFTEDVIREMQRQPLARLAGGGGAA